MVDYFLLPRFFFDSSSSLSRKYGAIIRANSARISSMVISLSREIIRLEQYRDTDTMRAHRLYSDCRELRNTR